MVPPGLIVLCGRPNANSNMRCFRRDVNAGSAPPYKSGTAAASAEKLFINFCPAHGFAVDLVGAVHDGAIAALLGSELGDFRIYFWMHRQVVVVAEYLLPRARHHEINEQLGRVRVRRSFRDSRDLQGLADRIERDPFYRRALNFADGGMAIVYLEANRILAGDHPIEHRPNGDRQRNDVLLGELAQIDHALLVAHAFHHCSDEAPGAGHGFWIPDDLALPARVEQVLIAAWRRFL